MRVVFPPMLQESMGIVTKEQGVMEAKICIKGRINTIGAIKDFKMLNVGLFEGNINADVFYSWITQELLESLDEKTVIVMDNASFHKREDSRKAIESKGHIILFLPPYNPDLNPIENKWAQAKSIRKKYRCDPYTLFQKFVI